MNTQGASLGVWYTGSMKIIVIFRDRSEHSRVTNEFIANVERRYPDKKIEKVELETRDGAYSAETYGVTRYPAIIACANDGGVLGMWEGEPLPLIDEVVSNTLEQQSSSV